MFHPLRLLIPALLLTLLHTSAPAANKGFGLGVIVGDPTGISAKLWLSEKHAFTGGVAWSFRGKTTLHIHGDYLIHHDLSSDVRNRELKQKIRPHFHYGIGGRLRDEIDDRIGIRFPLGITGQFNNAPLDIFIEIVPLLDLAPATEFDINAAVGARIFF